jgi:hypothetical protein
MYRRGVAVSLLHQPIGLWREVPHPSELFLDLIIIIDETDKYFTRNVK